MKLLIFKPKPNESEEDFCNHLWITKKYLKRAKRLTSSLLIHNYNKYYTTLSPYYLSITDVWKVPYNSYSYKPLTVVAYED